MKLNNLLSKKVSEDYHKVVYDEVINYLNNYDDEEVEELINSSELYEKLSEFLCEILDTNPDEIKRYTEVINNALDKFKKDRGINESVNEDEKLKTYVLVHKGPNDLVYCKNEYGEWTTHLEDALVKYDANGFSDAIKNNFADFIDAEVSELKVIDSSKGIEESFDDDLDDFSRKVYDFVFDYVKSNPEVLDSKEYLYDLVDLVADEFDIDVSEVEDDYLQVIDNSVDHYRYTMSESKNKSSDVEEMAVPVDNSQIMDRGTKNHCYVSAYEVDEDGDEEKLDNTQTPAIFLGNTQSTKPSSFFLIPLDNGNGATDSFFAYNTIVRSETDNGGYITGNDSNAPGVSLGVSSPSSMTKRFPDPYKVLEDSLSNPDVIEYLGVPPAPEGTEDLKAYYRNILGILRVESSVTKKKLKIKKV